MIPLPAPISRTSPGDARRMRPSSGPGGSQQASTRSGRNLSIAARTSSRTTSGPARMPETAVPRSSRRSRGLIRACGRSHLPESEATTRRSGAYAERARARCPSPAATSSTRRASRERMRRANARRNGGVGMK